MHDEPTWLSLNQIHKTYGTFVVCLCRVCVVTYFEPFGTLCVTNAWCSFCDTNHWIYIWIRVSINEWPYSSQTWSLVNWKTCGICMSRVSEHRCVCVVNKRSFFIFLALNKYLFALSPLPEERDCLQRKVFCSTAIYNCVQEKPGYQIFWIKILFIRLINEYSGGILNIKLCFNLYFSDDIKNLFKLFCNNVLEWLILNDLGTSWIHATISIPHRQPNDFSKISVLTDRFYSFSWKAYFREDLW